MHVFYHCRDLDGRCSGAIARYYHENTKKNSKVVMHPFDYGYSFPFDEITDGEKVWMLDVSTNPYDIMLEINNRYDLTVIDHHASFINSGIPEKLNGKFEIGKAACELTWKHCYGYGSGMPRLVHLLGRYDVWDKSDLDIWNKYILPTQMGVQLKNVDPKDGFEFWKMYFDDHFGTGDTGIVETTINKQGSIVLAYQYQMDKKNVNLNSFAAKFLDFNAICLNSARSNSQVFESVWDPNKYDLMFFWSSVKGERYTCSIITDKPNIDVSKIASAFGGGGHKQAAGFQCKNVVISSESEGKRIIINM